MKAINKQQKGKAPKPAKKAKGELSWSECKRQFTSLGPVDLKKLSHLTVPKKFRPMLSATAKAEGIEYVTFTSPEDDAQMVVMVF